MNPHYIFDKERRIWIKPILAPIAYNDGDEFEEYLAQVIRDASDVSSSSSELLSAIRDWPSEYHLSPVRHNLLSFCRIRANQSILELGCGCGAITRFLGETGAQVVGVEGSPRRASIAAERCRDLSNVRILCDNITNLELQEKFDFVTLVGVLEYARLFVEAEDPIVRCLQIAKSFLNENGVLILAMENQLGLKYFSGATEDHVGIPYFGVHDLYTQQTAVTFGKKELKDKLDAAEFVAEFIYPFPDYKLPSVLLTSKSLVHDRFRPCDLLHRAASRDYAGEYPRAFHEQLAWRAIVRNGMLPDMANSFLVLASTNKNRLEEHTGDWIARTFTLGRSHSFSIETIFTTSERKILVTKNPLRPSLVRDSIEMKNGKLFHEIVDAAEYVEGDLYIVELQLLLGRDCELDAVKQWAADWIYLLSNNVISSAQGELLPGDFLDATPENYIRSVTGELVRIDKEWRFSNPIPFVWVLIRGLVNAISVSPTSSSLAKLSQKQVIDRVVADVCKRDLTEQDYLIAADWEDTLRASIFGEPCQYSFNDSLNAPAVSGISGPTFAMIIEKHEKEVARIKSTPSWRITAPLRALVNYLKR